MAIDSKFLGRFYPILFALVLVASGYIVSHIQAYASGNVYGACAGLQQTQAICTDDPCGTGVATNYSTMEYNGYLPGNTEACSQYCCTNIAATATQTQANTPTNTQPPTPTVTQAPTPTTVPSPTPTLTPTSSPSNAQINITLCLHGLGNCGDNVSPNIGGNTNPKHMQRPVTVGLFNASDQQIASLTGAMSYSTSSAKFLITVSVPTTVPIGQYIVKIGSNGFLTKQVPGIIQITSGQTTTIPVLPLTNGNVNNDGQLDILDFNLIINCFGSKQSTASCTTPPTVNAAGSDINDDSIVDAADYNLFLRELSVQKGN